MDSRPEISLLNLVQLTIMEEAALSQEEREYRYAKKAYRTSRVRFYVDGVIELGSIGWLLHTMLTEGSFQWWVATFMMMCLGDFFRSWFRMKKLKLQMELALIATIQES